MLRPNPFTPKSGWEPKTFAGREYEFHFFEKKIREAEQNRCDHFLVLGEWGIGKTSLLKEFRKIAQEKGCISSMITIREFRKEEDLTNAVEHLVENIPLKLPVELSGLNNFLKQIESLGVQVLGTGFQLSRKTQAMDPQVFLLKCLLALWSDLKEKTDVLPVLLDDIQNFDKVSEIFTLIKNVLSDDEMLKTRYLFVLSCTPASWSKFMQLHHPIGRYFTPRIKLERLSEEENYYAVNKTLEGHDVIFEEGIKKKIYEYTRGHPYELQILCSNLYDTAIKNRVSEEQWHPALNETIINLGEIVWDCLYNEASEQERSILYILSLYEKPVERKEISAVIKKNKLGISDNAIGVILTRLIDKKLISKPDKYQYHIQDRLFKEYVRVHRGYGGNGNSPKLNI